MDSLRRGQLVMLNDQPCVVIDVKTDKQVMRAWDRGKTEAFTVFMDQNYGTQWLDDIYAGTLMAQVLHPEQGTVWIAAHWCHPIEDTDA